jgi:hypothetical protein
MGFAHFNRLEVEGSINLTGIEWLWMTDCWVDGTYVDAGTTWSVNIAQPYWSFLSNNHMERAMRLGQGGAVGTHTTFIYDNNIEGLLRIVDPYHVQASGNTSNGLQIVDLDSNGTSRVGGNIFTDDVTIDNCDHLAFDDNNVEISLGGGVPAITVNNSNDCSIANNYVWVWNAVANLAAALIDLTGTSDRCHVHGNTGRKAGGGGFADYFIRIGANCDDTKVWGNDGYGTWDTAALLDSGVGTDLTIANR